MKGESHVRKLIAFICVASLLISVPVLAADSPSAKAVVSSAAEPDPYVEAGFSSVSDSEQAASVNIITMPFHRYLG